MSVLPSFGDEAMAGNRRCSSRPTDLFMPLGEPNGGGKAISFPRLCSPIVCAVRVTFASQKPLPFPPSGDGCRPSGIRVGAEGAKCRSADQMALDVEGVVDRRVSVGNRWAEAWVRIPTEAGHLHRYDAGRRTDLKPARVPI